MTDTHFQRYINHLFPAPAKNASDRVRTNHQEKRITLDMLFTDAQTNHEIRGTQWAGYQAITEYIAHYAHYAPTQRTQWANTPEVLTAALFDDEAATSVDDGPGTETPHQQVLGGAFMVMAAA